MACTKGPDGLEARSAEQREVYLLHRERLGFAAIGKQLGISRATAAYHMTRAASLVRPGLHDGDADELERIARRVELLPRMRRAMFLLSRLDRLTYEESVGRPARPSGSPEMEEREGLALRPLKGGPKPNGGSYVGSAVSSQ